jgi:predicted dehydrogenase
MPDGVVNPARRARAADRALRVGVIGASPVNPGWAVAAHIPAIQALPSLRLAAVATSRPETARAAEQAFGVPAFPNAEELIAEDLDLVVVAVKAPLHHDVILAALRAGRAVFSEWPLGANLAEAERLAAAAEAAGVRHFAGLQARFSPVLRRVRDLLRRGCLGRVLASNLMGSGMAWGAETDAAHAYTFDLAAGANLVSVPVMHALDAMEFVHGDIAGLSSRLAVRRPDIAVSGTGQRIRATAPDHAAIAGQAADGAVVSLAYRGGTSRAGNLRWEINGTDADLLLTAENGNIQVADLKLSGGRGTDRQLFDCALAPLLPPEAWGMGANVRRLYAALAADLQRGTGEVPDFAHALRLHRQLGRILDDGLSKGMSR